MLVRVSVSARCLIPVGDKLLVPKSPGSIRRGKPALWPFGGGIPTNRGRQQLAAEYGAVDFEGGSGTDHSNDLRFKLPESKLSQFSNWLSKNQLSLPIVETATRELAEEAEERELRLDIARKIRFGPFKRVDQRRLDWSYLTKPVVSVLTECYDYMVRGTVSSPVARQIEELVATSSILELVTPAEINRGRSDRGTEIPEMCKLLLH